MLKKVFKVQEKLNEMEKMSDEEFEKNIMKYFEFSEIITDEIKKLIEENYSSGICFNTKSERVIITKGMRNEGEISCTLVDKLGPYSHLESDLDSVFKYAIGHIIDENLVVEKSNLEI